MPGETRAGQTTISGREVEVQVGELGLAQPNKLDAFHPLL